MARAKELLYILRQELEFLCDCPEGIDTDGRGWVWAIGEDLLCGGDGGGEVRLVTTGGEEVMSAALATYEGAGCGCGLGDEEPDERSCSYRSRLHAAECGEGEGMVVRGQLAAVEMVEARGRD